MRKFFLPAIPKRLIKDQFAFRPTGSTTAALVNLFHNVTGMLETDDHVRCFLIDFSKAFDTVSHSVLLDKLVAYNCPQFVINWLTNFLTGRYQSVVTLSGSSSKLSISRSIIQGSGIGPAAFLAMIADLHPKCVSTVFSKYADDLTVVIPGSAVSHAGDEINNIVQWSVRNKLRLNMSKTKEIVLYKNGNKKVVLPPTICNIEQVGAVKLLGVYFNSRLSFSGHVDSVLSIVNQRFYLINQLRKQGLDQNGLNIVFNSLVLSRLTYACQAFSGFLSESDLNRLQSCLNKACKWKLCSVRHDIREIFKSADNRLFTQITSDYDHCLHQLLPDTRNSHGRYMRKRGHQYTLPLVNTSLHKASFVVKCLYDFFMKFVFFKLGA